MDNTNTIQNNSTDIITLAVEKIKAEFGDFKGGTKETAVSSYVSTILQDFCKQDRRFAEVVYKFKRTLSDCCSEIMKGVTSYISDIDVYRNAVKFYFPNSEIEMKMTIDITGEAPPENEIMKEAEKPKEKPTPKKKSAEQKSKPVKTETSKAKTEEKSKQTDIPSGPIQLSLF